MDYPLIEIRTVPIEIRMKTKNATLEYSRGTAEMEISRPEGGGLNIKSRPVRLQVDSFEARNSICPTTARSISQAAQQGQNAAYEATASYADHGKLFVNAKLGTDAAQQIAKEPSNEKVNAQYGLTFIPTTGPEIDWEDGSLDIRYEMDKLNFEWKLENGEFKFTPGDIEISVEQQPDVVIKYMGGPLYVPPSADPDFESLDVRA